LDTKLNEQGSGHRILTDVLHHRQGVLKNEQGHLHLTRWIRRVRKLIQLDMLLSSLPTSKKFFIRGDLNEHEGSTRIGFDGVHGGFGYESRNKEEGVMNFALAYDLIVPNTLFRRKASHLVTFRSGQHYSQIDFILTRREDRHTCLDCKVIPGECVVP
jgi:hypothetical protein